MSCRVVASVMEDEAGGDEKLLAVPLAKLTQRYAHVTTTRTYLRSRSSRSSISSRTIRISSPTSGSRSSGGVTPTKRAGSW